MEDISVFESCDCWIAPLGDLHLPLPRNTRETWIKTTDRAATILTPAALRARSWPYLPNVLAVYTLKSFPFRYLSRKERASDSEVTANLARMFEKDGSLPTPVPPFLIHRLDYSVQ